MKRFLAVIIFTLLLSPLWAAEPEWSESVNGVRARLLLERQKDSPFLKIFIEIQNTSDVAGMKKIRFTPAAIQIQVTDESGTPLKRSSNPYDGMSPIWEPLQLPYEGMMRFQISFPGLGYQPTRDRTIIDLGPRSSWIIPNDQIYYISGAMAIPKQADDHLHSDWNGTLNFSKIPIPTK